MGFFANTKSDIKVFPDYNVENLYLDTSPRVKFTPGDIITFRSEFVRDLISSYRTYVKYSDPIALQKDSNKTYYNSICNSVYNSIARMNYNESQNIVSVLQAITSNLYEYIDSDKEPDDCRLEITPVICEKYNDADWSLIGNATRKCIYCAFVGPKDEDGMITHKSRICDRLDCNGIIFKKCK